MNAPEGGAFAEGLKGDRDVADILHRASSPEDLIAELDAARRRFDEFDALVNRALDLRELLWCGINLEEARDLVVELKRDVDRHKRTRR